MKFKNGDFAVIKSGTDPKIDNWPVTIVGVVFSPNEENSSYIVTPLDTDDKYNGWSSFVVDADSLVDDDD